MPNIPPNRAQPITDGTTQDPPTQERGALTIQPNWTMEVIMLAPLNPERGSTIAVSRKNNFYSAYNASYSYAIAELDRIRNNNGRLGGEVVPAVLVNDDGDLGILSVCSANVNYSDLLAQLRAQQEKYMPSLADYNAIRADAP